MAMMDAMGGCAVWGVACLAMVGGFVLMLPLGCVFGRRFHVALGLCEGARV